MRARLIFYRYSGRLVSEEMFFCSDIIIILPRQHLPLTVTTLYQYNYDDGINIL